MPVELNVPVWRELTTGDPTRAAVFYAGLFGWSLIDGQLRTADGRAVAGLSTGEPRWSAHVRVESVEATTAAWKRGGGSVAGSILRDPQGATLAIRQSGEPASEDPSPGHFCWETLSTGDAEAAAGFYEQVFGWIAGASPGGGTVFNAGMLPVADLRTGSPARWVSHVLVAKLEASRDRAVALGGTIVEPLIELPGLGRVAVLADPDGAVFGIYEALT